MSKCDLRITIENKKEVYLTGDEVSGYVDVLVNKDCRCDGLTIALKWETHGKGNVAIGDIDVNNVYEGDLKAGQEKSFPFTFQIPEEGPVTYHGEYLNIDWYIKAQVDIPWAIDPRAELELLVEPDPEKREQRAEVVANEDDPLEEMELSEVAQTAVKFLPAFGGALVLGFAFFLFWEVYSSIDKFELVQLIFFIAIGVFAVIGGTLVYSGVRNSLAQMRLGKVAITCTPEQLFPGESTRVQVSFTPQAKFALTGLMLTLHCKEEVISGSGTNQTTHTKELYCEDFVLASDKKFHPGEPQLFEAEVPIPANATPSFETEDNELQWYFTVHFDIPKWPDWIEKHPIWILF